MRNTIFLYLNITRQGQLGKEGCEGNFSAGENSVKTDWLWPQ